MILQVRSYYRPFSEVRHIVFDKNKPVFISVRRVGKTRIVWYDNEQLHEAGRQTSGRSEEIRHAHTDSRKGDAMRKTDRVYDSSDFVVLSDYVPHTIQEIRYHTSYNFVGERVDGYEEPVALITKEAARALKTAAHELFVMGYQLKIFDAYRPARAVKHFIFWGIEDQDIRMKPYFYPDLEKQELFSRGYIAKESSHSRGSTVDLTLLDMKTGQEADMGSPFDFFGEISHPDSGDVTDEQFRNRMLLQKIMVRNGFVPIDCEWWHFTLGDEPYPDTYFDFPVCMESLRR